MSYATKYTSSHKFRRSFILFFSVLFAVRVLSEWCKQMVQVQYPSFTDDGNEVQLKDTSE